MAKLKVIRELPVAIRMNAVLEADEPNIMVIVDLERDNPNRVFSCAPCTILHAPRGEPDEAHLLLTRLKLELASMVGFESMGHYVVMSIEQGATDREFLCSTRMLQSFVTKLDRIIQTREAQRVEVELDERARKRGCN